LKYIIKYLREFIKADFNPYVYGYTFLFLAAAISINYTFNFEEDILESYKGQDISMLHYFLFYSFAYYCIVIPKILIEKRSSILHQKEFWIKSLVFLALIGIYGGFEYYGTLASLFTDPYESYFVRKVLVNMYGPVLYIIPLLILKIIYDRDVKGFYGLKLKGFDPSPYLVMLFVMIPLIFWASFQNDFQETYPEFKPWLTNEIFGLSKRQLSAIYEFFYGLDFISVEMIFRGAFVIGMAKVMGKDSVLPMVSVYAFLHFGKPLAETLGSIFGGYILGVIALSSGNILGGCMIHMGVALLMDFAALVQYYYIKKIYL
jgi:hypothetical protein